MEEQNSHQPLLNLWQSPFWQKFQKKLGRKTWFFQKENSSALVIKHNLLGKLCWLDLPRGPLGSPIDQVGLLQEVIQSTQAEKPVFIRIMSEKKLSKLNNFKIALAHYNHQPETTLKIDLTLSETEILNQMKPKGRYNIRLAEKKGVKVFASQDIQKFYTLIQTTTARNNFSGHNLGFYKTLLETFQNQAILYLAEYAGEIIAGGIFIFTEQEAIYYYGASGNLHREVMAPYLIQWTAIQEAKTRGCKTYDFLGIAPVNATKQHPWRGVTEFKLKFGGEVINYPPAQEIILRPFFYFGYLFLKKLRYFFKF